MPTLVFPVPDGPACPIALIGDSSLSNVFGDETDAYMRSIFGDVQSVFEDELGLRLPIVYLHVMPGTEQLRNGTTIREFLLEHGNRTSQMEYPGFEQMQKHVCLVHVMSARDFRDQLGLAWVCPEHQLQMFDLFYW